MPSVAIIGTRGYPSYYGGFETAVRKLAPFLCDAGWDVTVFGRPGSVKSDDPDRDPRVRTVQTRGLETRSLSTLSYGFSSVRQAVREKFDVALVMNVANGFFLPRFVRSGIPTLVNVDGIEWDRDKWNGFAKRVFHMGASCTAKSATELVFDAKAIGDRWRSEFKRDGVFIPYGGEERSELPSPLGLKRRSYTLLVARFVPENSISEFFSAVPALSELGPVVLVGSTGYGGPLDEEAGRLASELHNVHYLGHVADDDLLSALWQNAGAYFHGHSVGGTNPALVQAMMLGAPVVARSTVYNREVLADEQQICEPVPSNIVQMIEALLANPAEQERRSTANMARARVHYNWPDICAHYEHALRRLIKP
ncbi:glycosyltransferase [Microbacterium sp. che218]|uniref:glycosyltransferase n=1 Tax=Microbacterium sp. che218 TaxID=3140649 RepID=UPI00336732B4